MDNGLDTVKRREASDEEDTGSWNGFAVAVVFCRV